MKEQSVEDMKISIITVAYNCEESIGQTIQSVLSQSLLKDGKLCSTEDRTGPGQSRHDKDRRREQTGVEYLIIDGGSTDKTVAVAESYRAAMKACGVQYDILSEPDDGIYDAMNKGIRQAGGEVIGILNCKDRYEPDTLFTVQQTFSEQKCDLLFGNIRICKENGSTFIKKARQRKYQTSRDWNHPTTFVKAELYKKYPFRNLGIHDDYGFYLQMRRQGRKIVTLDKVLAEFYMGGASNHKSLKAACKRIRDRYLYCYRINGYSRWYIVECVLIEAAKMLLS